MNILFAGSPLGRLPSSPPSRGQALKSFEYIPLNNSTQRLLSEPMNTLPMVHGLKGAALLMIHELVVC